MSGERLRLRFIFALLTVRIRRIRPIIYDLLTLYSVSLMAVQCSFEHLGTHVSDSRICIASSSFQSSADVLPKNLRVVEKMIF